MRIHLLSDLHFEFQNWRRTWCLDQVEADVHVLAGDIGVGLEGIQWALDHFTRPVIYVMGNHEFYGQRPMVKLMSMAREKTAGTHVHLLENDSVVIDGVRFLGCTLWSDFCLFGEEKKFEMMQHAQKSMTDYHSIHVHRKGIRHDCISIYDGGQSHATGDRLTPDYVLDLHKQSIEFLERELERAPDPSMVPEPWNTTIVVTHHAPSPSRLPNGVAIDPVDAAYATYLEGIVQKSDMWLHGHTHIAREQAIGNTRVIANCRGYRDAGEHAVSGFNPLYTVTV